MLWEMTSFQMKQEAGYFMYKTCDFVNKLV